MYSEQVLRISATGKADVVATVPQQTDCIPDGCAIDADDHVCVADSIGRRVMRVAPAGRVVDVFRSHAGWASTPAPWADHRRAICCCAQPRIIPT